MPYDEFGEDHFGPCATPSEAVAEFGRNAGAMQPEKAWLLHDWDVWVPNPFYRGPRWPHPESDEAYDYEGASEPVQEADSDADHAYPPGAIMNWGPRNPAPDDDFIPF